MKKNIVYITGLLLCGVLTNSCSKQLQITPTDIIQPAVALNTILGLQEAVFNVYGTNGGSSNRVYIASILADDAKIGSGNRGQGTPTFEWQYSSTPEAEQNSDFAAYYSMIDDGNRILQVIDSVPTFDVAEVNLKKRFKAELLALRGYAHFQILTEFMASGYPASGLGIPIALQDSLFGLPARAKVSDVIAQISTDLAAGRAETNIPNAPDSLFRLSQAAIAAIQARVALLTRDWVGAVNYAKAALALSGKGLATDFQDYANIWTDASPTESIWKFTNASPSLYWTDSNGDIFFSPSDELLSDYDQTNDIRFEVFFSPNTANVTKYPGSATGPQVNDIQLVRTSELYLDIAEGLAQQNDTANARLYLDSIRSARIQNYTTQGFASQADAIAQVLDERYKELCFEGNRFFDLKRYNLPIQRFSSDVGSPNWQVLQAGNYHFALPIPQHELFANENIVQNPGY